MDASKLIEIRAREATKFINRAVAVESSVLTFTKAANTVAAAGVSEAVAGGSCCGRADGSKGSGSHVPTCDAVVMRAAGCCSEAGAGPGQLGVIVVNSCCPEPLPVIQQEKGRALPCACSEERRFVPRQCSC